MLTAQHHDENSVAAYQKKFVLQPLFTQKDVAKFQEARTVTRSLQIESNSLNDVGHQLNCVQSIFDD
jgi:hypothetical protein